MRQCLQMTALLLVGFPCFLCCFLLLRKGPFQDDVRRTLPWAGGFTLLFSALASGFALFLPVFFSCILALLLCAGVIRLLGRGPFSLALLFLFSCCLLTLLAETLVWLLAKAFCRCLGLSAAPSLWAGILPFLSILLSLGACLLKKKGLFRDTPGDCANLLSAVCCALFALALLMAALLEKRSTAFQSILPPLLLLLMLLCVSGLRDQKQKRLLKRELDQKIEEARRLQVEIHNYRGLVQSNRSRVEEMAELVSRFHAAQGSFGTELAAEFDGLQESTRELCRLTGKHAREELLSGQNLPPCGFPQLEQLLKNCLELCVENGILLNLSVITPLEPRYRPPELEDAFLAATIAEHVLDAVRAILRAGQEEGEIDVTMGLLASGEGDSLFYGVDIFDNGEPFSLEILAQLGAGGGVTTGGSGIGFPTTLNRLALCNGSLIVRDLNPEESSSMTSCVSLLFDGKRRFLILSDSRQAQIDSLRQKGRERGLVFFDSTP